MLHINGRTQFERKKGISVPSAGIAGVKLVALGMLLLAFSHQSTAEQMVPRIIGGEVALEGDYPFMAGVYSMKNGFSIHCGGVLIAPQWVLTAAHCIYETDKSTPILPSDLRVSVGLHNKFDPDAELYGVIEVYQAEYDSLRSKNDIALLKLDQEADEQPISLPDSEVRAYLDKADPDKLFRAIGWGLTNQNPDVFAQELRYVDLDYVENSQCPWSTDDTQICAGGQNKDTCRGDSGGPLIAQYQGQLWLMGLTSFGARECGQDEAVGVYTDVSAFKGWIESNINDAGGSIAFIDGDLASVESVGRPSLEVSLVNRSSETNINNVGFTLIAAAGITVESDEFACHRESVTSHLCSYNGTLAPSEAAAGTLVLASDSLAGSVVDVSIFPSADQYNAYKRKDKIVAVPFNVDTYDLKISVTQSNLYTGETSGWVRIYNKTGEAIDTLSFENLTDSNLGFSDKGGCGTPCFFGELPMGGQMKVPFTGTVGEDSPALELRIDDAQVGGLASVQYAVLRDRFVISSTEKDQEDQPEDVPGDDESVEKETSSGSSGGGGALGIMFGLFLLLGSRVKK
jgi:secreted trypsin-like serine protease